MICEDYMDQGVQVLGVGTFEGLANCISWQEMFDLTHPVLSDSVGTASYQYMPTLLIPHHTIVDPDHVVQYTEHNFQYGAIRSTLDSLMSPEIALSPDYLDFGVVPQGNSVDRMLVIYNAGTGILQVSDIIASNPDFEATPTADQIYAIRDSMVVTVSFSPSLTGSYTDSLMISSSGGIAAVALSGIGEAVVIDDLMVEVSIPHILLSWSEVPGANGYNIYVSSNPNVIPAPENLFAYSTTNHYDDNFALTNNGTTARFYCVTAVFQER